MRKPPSTRGQFEFRLSEDYLAHDHGDESARHWGAAFAGWTAVYLSFWPGRQEMQALPNFDAAGFSHVSYGDVAQELAYISGIGASIISFEKKYGRERLTRGKVFENRKLMFELETEEELLEGLVHLQYASDEERQQFQHALASSNISGLDQGMLCSLICENIYWWSSARDIKDDPPSAVEVNEKLRMWMHIADRFDWLAQHGDALPRRPAGS
jgi:hypothetical protein